VNSFTIIEPEASCEVAEYNETAAALTMLAGKYATVVFDVSTKTGLEQAKAARAELRGYRVNLENLRKSIKAPALNHCRLIDEEAKSITGKLEALEKPIAAQIEAEEARKEAEKQAKLQVEIARVEALRARIKEISDLAETCSSLSTTSESLIKAKSIEIGTNFEELQPDAQQAKDAAIYRLQNMQAQWVASEAEAEQIRVDRAKLAQLEAESAARRAEDDRKAAEERARLANEQEARLAEERRIADEAAAAELVRQAEERHRVDAQLAEERHQQVEQARLVREAQQAEQKRLDAIAADLRQKEEAAAYAERQCLAAVNAADELVRKAAPLLLEALEDAMQWFSKLKDWSGVGDPNVKMYSKAIALAKGKNYFAEDGTLMNADGTRSVFDDVDQ